METASELILVLLVIIAFNNYRHGTLGHWLRAKFLNSAEPNPADLQGQAAATTAGAAAAASVAGAAAAGQLGGAPSGGWVSPLKAFTVSQVFGAKNGRDAGGHPGIDLAVPNGTPVYAANAGTVTRAGLYDGYGVDVDIDHGGGMMSRYGHLLRALVAPGQHVNAGDEIALSNNTGESTGPHVHFEIRVNGTPTNPAPYIGITNTLGVH